MDCHTVLTEINKPILNSPVKPIDTSYTSKNKIRSYFENAYDLYESLFSSLKDEKTFYYCPDRLRLPLIFYFGHTSAVYINKLILVGLIKERVNLNFETMFETGVDEMSWDDTEHYRMGRSYEWPSLDKVVEFRRKVRNTVYKVIEDTPLELPITADSPWWAVLMGIEHERIHFETSTVLIRQLPVHLVQEPAGWLYAPSAAPVEGPRQDKNSMIKVAETTVIMGKPRNVPTFGWDNEYPQWERRVPAFEASQHLVTNGEFLEFVKDSGYQRKKLWSQEGWQWKTSTNIQHPAFWVCSRGCKSNCGGIISSYSHCQLDSDEINTNREQKKTLEYKYRAMFSLMDLPMEWPVEVNYHVAKAYCTWQGPGYRLITECEHLALRDPQKSSDDAVSDDVAFQEFSKPTCNVNCVYGSSNPVKLFPPNERGFYDVHGNTWEWTEDHFNGFPGFKTNFLYDDFSTPCLDGRHNLMMGGSWATTGMNASSYYRAYFRRHFYQHSGFRLVHNAADTDIIPASVVTSEIFILGQGTVIDNSSTDGFKVIEDWKRPSANVQYAYETEDHLNTILLSDYGIETDNYAVTVAGLVKRILKEKGIKTEKALHVGSSAGRLTFELATDFNHVMGLDYCARYIDACQQLKSLGRLSYSKPISELEPKKRKLSNGDDNTLVALVPEHIDRQRLTFTQMTWISNELIGFDAVFVDFLYRVMNKEAWINRLWEIVEPNGLVFILLHDGLSRDNIAEHSRNRLKFVEEHQTRYINGLRENIQIPLTIWKRLV